MAKELFEQLHRAQMREAIKPSRSSMVFFFIMTGLLVLLGSCFGDANYMIAVNQISTLM